mmetsp:Transcript_118291/g.379108  ORF Transcript_118291/g.379108 Transcript_118291/m.379108 type:complete len:90 (+) Transcript_118291:311-580(+)
MRSPCASPAKALLMPAEASPDSPVTLWFSHLLHAVGVSTAHFEHGTKIAAPTSGVHEESRGSYIHSRRTISTIEFLMSLKFTPGWAVVS